MVGGAGVDGGSLRHLAVEGDVRSGAHRRLPTPIQDMQLPLARPVLVRPGDRLLGTTQIADRSSSGMVRSVGRLVGLHEPYAAQDRHPQPGW